jgi:hypothetical protein
VTRSDAALLAPVRVFVDPVAAKSADQVADGFTEDGVVIDVSRRIQGARRSGDGPRTKRSPAC